MARGRTGRTDRAREKFLSVLRETCNVTESSRAAGISRTSAYEWRGADADFAAAWAEAEEEAADKLEREAWRRAVDGIDRPIVHQGQITASYKEYSDKLLEILLKAHRPDKFKERVANEHFGKDGKPIEIDVKGRAAALDSKISSIAARLGAGGNNGKPE